jgi:hypothetical protein
MKAADRAFCTVARAKNLCRVPESRDTFYNGNFMVSINLLILQNRLGPTGKNAILRNEANKSFVINDCLQLLVETGLAGFSIVFWCWSSAAPRARVRIGRRPPAAR